MAQEGSRLTIEDGSKLDLGTEKRMGSNEEHLKINEKPDCKIE